MMTTDRVKLKAMLDRHPNGEYNLGEFLEVVVPAARAHLATLTEVPPVTVLVRKWPDASEPSISFQPGDKFTMAAAPPTRWQRFKAWVTGVPIPSTRTYVVSATSAGDEGQQSNPVGNWP